MLTVWKKLTSTFSGTLRLPMVPGLCHSVKSVAPVPNSKIPAVKKRTNLVWKRRRRFFFLPSWVAKSNQTIKPRPPVIIKPAITRLIKGSVWKVTKLLLPKLSKPALQKAEMAKKIEVKMPRPQPNSGIKRKLSRKAPNPSTRKVVKKIDRIKAFSDRVSP